MSDETSEPHEKPQRQPILTPAEQLVDGWGPDVEDPKDENGPILSCD